MKTTKTTLLSFFAAALLAASPGIAVAADSEDAVTAYDYAFKLCETVLEEERKDSDIYSYMKFWTTGYMMAIGLFQDETQNEYGVFSDIDGFMHLIHEYCEENPFLSLSLAAFDVAEILRGKAGSSRSRCSCR